MTNLQGSTAAITLHRFQPQAKVFQGFPKNSLRNESGFGGIRRGWVTVPLKECFQHGGTLNMSKVATPSMGQKTSQMMVPHEKIAMRAYEKWCKRGCPHGTSMLDWLEAERELMTENSRSPAASQRR
jgi:hypothetical protein